MHTGTVVSGIIGKTKFTFDIWGDAVNLASRMESTGVPGATQVSGDVYEVPKDLDEPLLPRGLVEVKGKGKVQTYIDPAFEPPPDPLVNAEPLTLRRPNVVDVLAELVHGAIDT